MTCNPTPPKRPDVTVGRRPSDSNSKLIELNRQLHGQVARLLGGQSPWAALQAWEDWAFHLMLSPARQTELFQLALGAALSLSPAALNSEAKNSALGPKSDDRRFRHPGWKRSPFNLLVQAQLATEAQWHAATRNLPGVTRLTEECLGWQKEQVK